MRPVSIKKVSPTDLKFVWDSGHESVYSLRELRDLCPCAGCSGERVLLRDYRPPEPDRTTPGRYDLKGVQQVGSYAVQLQWGDGHSTGIYTWEYLMANCPCVEHHGGRTK